MTEAISSRDNDVRTTEKFGTCYMGSMLWNIINAWYLIFPCVYYFPQAIIHLLFPLCYFFFIFICHNLFSIYFEYFIIFHLLWLIIFRFQILHAESRFEIFPRFFFFLFYFILKHFNLATGIGFYDLKQNFKRLAFSAQTVIIINKIV